MVWQLPVAANAQVVVGYQVPEAASGVSQARLMDWVHAYQGASWQQALLIAHPGLVSRAWISPSSLQLNVGQTDRLEVHARLHNGQVAPRADLTDAVWTTTNPAVVVVSRSGQVTAMSPGSAVIWVRIGAIRAEARVVVSGPAGQPPPYSEPPVQQIASPSPSGPTPTSGSPSPSGSTPTSGSSTPTSPPPSSTPPTSPSAG